MVASVIIADFAKAISIRPPPSLEGGLGRELARAEATVFWGNFQVFILYLVETKPTKYKVVFLWLFLINSVCYEVNLWLLSMIPPLTPPLKPRGEDRIEYAVILVLAACLSAGSVFVFIFNKFSVL